MTAGSEEPIAVQHVFALVELQDRVIKETREREAAAGPDAPKTLINRNQPGPGRLNVDVSLSAQTSDGQRIPSGRHDFGMGGGKHGINGVWHRYHGPQPDDADDLTEYIQRNHHVGPADLEDGINQMLGRDPELHRPPRLSWTNLIKALAEHGIQVTEEDLITVPLTVDLHPEVQAELETDR
jgi:hypothetical protein